MNILKIISIAIIALSWAIQTMATDHQIMVAEDAWIYQKSTRVAWNLGTHPNISVGENGQVGGNTQRGLIQFDLSGLSGTVDTALCSLYVQTIYWSGAPSQPDSPDTLEVQIHKLLVDWWQGTQAGATCTDSGVTWNYTKCSATYGIYWYGGTAGTHYKAAAYDSVKTYKTDFPQWVVFDVTDFVRDVVEDDSTNNGFMLKVDESSVDSINHFWYITSQDSSASTAHNPRLHVEITPVGAVDTFAIALDTFYTQACGGAFITRNMPIGLYHDNKTYIFFQGNGENPMAIYFDHDDSTWSSAYYVGANPLLEDVHGVPSGVRDNDGYFHVFYGCHNDNMQYGRSTNPNDISAWTNMGTVTNSATYAQPVVETDNDIWLFYRSVVTTGKGWFYKKSTDGGDTWSEAANIITMGSNKWVYNAHAEYDATNNRVHFVWYYYDTVILDDGGAWYNIYHAYMNLSNGQMYTVRGGNLGSEITLIEATDSCLVFDSDEEIAVNAPRLHLDSDGYPYIIFNKTDTTSSQYATVNNNRFVFIRWNGSSWTTPVEITKSGIGYGNDFYIVNDDTIVVFLGRNDMDATVPPTQNQTIHRGKIQEWKSTNRGLTWEKMGNVYSEEMVGMETIHLIKDPFSQKLKLVFSQFDADLSTEQGGYQNPLKVYAVGLYREHYSKPIYVID